jgi:hypothetical protein
MPSPTYERLQKDLLPAQTAPHQTSDTFSRLSFLLQRANAGLIDCRGPPLAEAHLPGND